MLIGQNGPAVIISARTAAWLERYAGLSALRVRVRGTDPQISAELQELRVAAMSWRGSATGTEEAAKPEPDTESDQWLSTGEAALVAGVTDRAIRKAISDGRLPATDSSGRHRISREDLEHYRAARTA